MIFYWLDRPGVAVFAVSGALAAGRVGVNRVGVNRLAVAGLSSGPAATAETT